MSRKIIKTGITRKKRRRREIEVRSIMQASSMR
jgi:hypothetical protein